MKVFILAEKMEFKGMFLNFAPRPTSNGTQPKKTKTKITCQKTSDCTSPEK
jgi:hypothetical protein